MSPTSQPPSGQELRVKPDQLPLALEMGQEDHGSRRRPGRDQFVVASLRMQQLSKMIDTASQHTFPVLIVGESGTGKELVARSIHDSGPRAGKPFVPVDCAALTSTLIESELFGHLKGAFTGATHTKHGLVQAANGGTLFLDEIGELPFDLQSKLLRVMQEKEIRPVGSTERIPVNGRVTAATNRDLEAAVRSGTFRQDLYFRLNVMQIKLPPLRERKIDIPLLVSQFLEKFSGPHQPVHTISEDVLRRLLNYDWPGNIRELENAIERAVALSSESVLQVDDLPSSLHYPDAPFLPEKSELLLMPPQEIERRAIIRVLQETNGDKVAAAQLLGIGKTTLYRKLKQYARESPQAAVESVSQELL
jgi:transcriptional regulator with PAS, ATPase and Fis domain